MAMKGGKRVYTFGNGQAEGRADMRNELGGKGANLAEMNLIGVPCSSWVHHNNRCLQRILRDWA